ncbi:hypothetical protein AAF712_015632 [Marasmius tenuissimus]|uniref:Uncharacterized protein n=1 Tax=Marasmius tenuissimus TaxID=585030 RepID=A0ABR2ZB72_9AGAR
MPRLKLYSTKAQRQEANQNKNKCFYVKSCLKILDSKKDKRLQERQAQETHEIQERKKQCERSKQETKGNLDAGSEHPEEAISPPPVNVEKELEDQLEDLKGRYQRHIPSGHRQFLHDLSTQALQWKHSQRGSMMTRTLVPSPVIVAKRAINVMLDEYHDLEDYYFWCLHNRKGQVWEEKRQNFWAFEDVVLKLLAVLDNMSELLSLAGNNPSLDDFRDLYLHQYQY